MLESFTEMRNGDCDLGLESAQLAEDSKRRVMSARYDLGGLNRPRWAPVDAAPILAA